jgi:hypothetical protein
MARLPFLPCCLIRLWLVRALKLFLQCLKSRTPISLIAVLNVLCIEVYSYVESPKIFYLRNLLRITYNRALGLTFDILRKQIFWWRVYILLLKFERG